MTTTDLSRTVNGEITIRRAALIADYHACQEAQRQAWGIGDDSYLVPIATLIGANLHGGLVLGAFLPGGEAVGMSFAFLGRVQGRPCLYSQLTGVIPAYQSRGLGYEIKLLQRDIARAEGSERIAWAFDPLQAGNAHFNLARLGASAGLYVDNMYGLRTDALSAGAPTDRLIAEWETEGQPAAQVSVDSALLPRLIPTGQRREVERRGRRGPELEPAAAIDVRAFDKDRILLEIPSDIVQLRREAPMLAERWRSIVGRAFQAAFAAGYRAVYFVKDDSSGQRRGFYVLERL